MVGMPIRITIGDKSLKDGKVELKARRERDFQAIPIDQVVEAVKKMAESLD